MRSLDFDIILFNFNKNNYVKFNFNRKVIMQQIICKLWYFLIL